ncbi:MAG: hypothetical protein GXO35_07725 [Gammaproteobacteria bacterium]|nr:hypothetical protein [Gammaproteobacteria bacterium]
MKRTRVKRSGQMTAKEYVWSQIRELKTFTISHISSNAPLSYKLSKEKVNYHIKGWVAAGFLGKECIHSKDILQPKNRYTLIKDTGIEPPRVDSKGNKLTKGLGREQMWRTMRITGEFTHKQLAVTASTEDVIIAEATAKSYVSALYRAGYLKITKPSNTHGGLAVYMLKPAAWTGAKPPMVKRIHVVYDQNIHEIVYPKKGDIQSDY